MARFSQTQAAPGNGRARQSRKSYSWEIPRRKIIDQISFPGASDGLAFGDFLAALFCPEIKNSRGRLSHGAWIETFPVMVFGQRREGGAGYHAEITAL